MSNKFLSAVEFDNGLAQSVTFSAIVSADLPPIAFSGLSDVSVADVPAWSVLYYGNDGLWHYLPPPQFTDGYLHMAAFGAAPSWQAFAFPGDIAYTDVANIFTLTNTFSSSPTAPFGGSNGERFGSGAGSATTTGDNNVYLGYQAGNTGTTARFNVCVGADSDVAAVGTSEATAIGGQASAASSSVAVGRGANASGSSSVAIGQTATASGSTAVCIGAAQTVSVSGGVAVGTGNSVTGGSSVAVGKNNTTAKQASVLLGESGTAEADGELRYSNRQTGGTFLIVSAVSSTTGDRKQWRVSGTWVDNTDASRKARAVFEVYDTAVREAFRIEASGSAAMIGFLGTAAAVQQTGDIGDALVTYGLLTSPSLKVANGGTGGTKGAPKTLFDHFASQGNGTTVETDLYSDTTAAGQLAANGEKLEAEYGGTFVSSATATREVKLYFGGTVIFDTGALTLSLSSAWTLFASVIRVSSSVVRYMISFTTEGAALSAYTAVGELTGLTLANTNVLKVTGQAAGVGAATNDIVAMLGSVSWVPAA